MAQITEVKLIDDIDQSTAEETVSFGLDGQNYEIDLSKGNADKLRDALAPYVAHARRSSAAARGQRGGGGGGRRGGGGGNGRPSAADRKRTGEIRNWARSQGLQVNDRGRISADIIRKFEEAHA